MAEDLTFAKGRALEAWHPEVSIFDEKEFYSAVGTDTQAVYRFVIKSTHGTAATAAKQFSAVASAGVKVMGVVLPHIHDDKDKEYYDTVAVGKRAPIVHSSTRPVLVEAGAGITAGAVSLGDEISTDSSGKATAATSGQRVVAHAVEAVSINSVTYVRLLLAPAGRVV